MHKHKKIQGTVSKRKEGSAEEVITLETIFQGGLMRGLRMDDTETMTLGMWVDYVIEWNNIHMTDEHKDANKATQADFDAF